jgi:hypothetical protein
MKSHELIDKDLPSIDKTCQVLRYLNTGREIELDGHTYKLAETLKEGFTLVVLVSPERDIWHGADMSIEHLSILCNNLTDDELTIMSANIALTKINQRN